MKRHGLRKRKHDKINDNINGLKKEKLNELNDSKELRNLFLDDNEVIYK